MKNNLLIFSALVVLIANAQNNNTTIETLFNESKKAHSSAVVVFKDGKLWKESYFESSSRKIEAMSVTKSIVSLGIGRLIMQGKIKSINQPIHEFYPEWNQGRKKEITIKHLLNHTSGLQNYPNTSVEIYPSPDFIKLALAAELENTPGTKFLYNNKAVNLLAGIIEKASRVRMDEFFKVEIFKPMGIIDFSWSVDSAGNPHAMSGLQIFPKDLAKIGQLVLNRGKWNGNQLIHENWFDIMLIPSQNHYMKCGLLWWLIPQKTYLVIDDIQIERIKSTSLEDSIINKLERLKGRYENEEHYIAKVDSVIGLKKARKINDVLNKYDIVLERTEFDKTIGFRAEGYLGQYLIIYPEKNIVAVRMIEWSEDYNKYTDLFKNFEDLVYKLTY